MGLEQDFLDDVQKSEIPATHPLILDGNLRRYQVNGDRRGRKNGWYRFVQVTHDFAYGMYGSNRLGLSRKWTSKKVKEITNFERKEWKKKQNEQKSQLEELHSKAAAKAQRMWQWLPDAVKTHPYALKKGIRPYGLKQLNSSLVIPVYVDNCISSFEYVDEKGGKRYLYGSRTEGGYYWIGKETDVIYIVEGYATGVSIYEATGAHVVIAFSAYNVPNVAKMLRERKPEVKIIIAADNDQWTVGNPGISYAQQAQREIGADIRFPPFSPEDKNRPKDWNDYHQIFGTDALLQELTGTKEVSSPANISKENLWRQQLIAGKARLPGFVEFDGKSKHNVWAFLNYHDFFKELVALNIFSGHLIFTRQAAWESGDFIPRTLENKDYFQASMALERFEIKTSKEVVQDAWESIGGTRHVNPPRDYLEALVWDGQARLDKWLTYYLGAEKQNPEYLALVGSKWIMGAVSRIYQPGTKFDNVLILEGGQDNKKSMVFEKITQFREEPYFLEFSGDITKPDSLGAMQGKIVVEMSELASMNKAIIEEMKTFVTRKKDTFRPAWGKTILERKRVFILAATTNNDSADGYLVDPTGNRRYWPVACGTLDIEAVVRDKDQLWAEAVQRWKDGERTWLESDEEKELAKFEQSERQHEDSWLEPIDFYLSTRLETDIYHICREALHMDTNQIKKIVQDRVAKCLQALGWVRNPVRPRTEEKRRITVWNRKIPV